MRSNCLRNDIILFLNYELLVQLKETAERILAVDRAASMVEEMLKQGHIGFPSLQTPMCNGVQVDTHYTSELFELVHVALCIIHTCIWFSDTEYMCVFGL